MRVMAQGHVHGMRVGPERPDLLIGVTESADADRATKEATAHMYKRREEARDEANRIFSERLKSAVDKLK